MVGTKKYVRDQGCGPYKLQIKSCGEYILLGKSGLTKYL